MKSAVATGCDGDVELITGSFQVDRLILRLDVVVVFYFSDGLQLCCNEHDAVWISLVSVMNSAVGRL